METNSNSVARKGYIKNVLAADIGILIICGFICVVFKLNIGIVLLFSGILVGGIGAFLSDQTSLHQTIAKDIPSKHFLEYMPPPNEFLSGQSSRNAEDKVPRYGFANVMTLAGFIIIVLSIAFFIIIRLSS
jgi:hypothetical protein